MIKVKFFKNNDGYQGFEVSGHAGYAEYGSDIVCASVSCLVINTINSIENFTDCKFSLKENEKKGYISFRLKDKPTEYTELLIKSLSLGLINICKEYDNEYITIIFEEV